MKTTTKTKRVTIKASDIKRGNFFMTGNEMYILGMVDTSKYALISIVSGNRWIDAVKVKDITKVTLTEWKEISKLGEFKPVPSGNILFEYRPSHFI